jgi:hypothetical protein
VGRFPPATPATEQTPFPTGGYLLQGRRCARRACRRQLPKAGVIVGCRGSHQSCVIGRGPGSACSVAALVEPPAGRSRPSGRRRRVRGHDAEGDVEPALVAPVEALPELRLGWSALGARNRTIVQSSAELVTITLMPKSSLEARRRNVLAPRVETRFCQFGRSRWSRTLGVPCPVPCGAAAAPRCRAARWP